MIFEAFLGVDQTGAAVRGGAAARPLPCALLRRAGARWRLTVRDRWLPALDAASVDAITGGVAPVALMVDCVFGLPRSIARPLGLPGRGAQPLWRLFERAAAGEALPRYGRAAGEAFFAALAASAGGVTVPLPRRDCEVCSNATSVFQTRPYQRNVQTGTHRIWRDLAARGSGWASIWPFEPPAAPRVLFESFPTLFWQRLFGLRTRSRPDLPAAIARAFRGRARLDVDDWDAIVSDPERADAAVLALGGLLLQLDARLLEPFAGFTPRVRRLGLEGWIAGLAAA